MAIFNPNPADVPEQDFLRLSKPISDLKPNTTTAETLKGLGDVGGDAIKVAHTLVQGKIEDEEYDRLSAIRGDFTKGLDKVYANLTGQPQTTVSDASMQVLSSSPAAQMPKDVEDVPKTLESLEAARASGKYSQTYLDMKYDSVLKDLRSRYPGWKPFIDKKAQEVTGRDPANDYIKSKIGDINSWVQAQNTDKDKVLTEAYKDENYRIPGMPVWIEMFKSGQVSRLQFNEFMNSNQRVKYDLEQDRMRLEKIKMNKEYFGIQAEDIASKTVSQLVTNNLATIYAGAGENGDSVSFVDKMTNMSKDPAGARELGQNILANAAKIKAAAMAALKVPDANGNVVWNILGPEKAEKLIDNNLQLHKTYADMISNQQFGAATLLKNQNEGLLDRSTNAALKNPDINRDLISAHVINTLAGPTAAAAVFDGFLKNNLFGNVRAAVNSDQMNTTAGKPDSETKGQPTLSLTADQLNRAKAAVKEFGDPRTMDSYIKMVEGIADPKFAGPEYTEVKKNWIKYAFSPEGQGFISKIQKDGIDPNTGKPTAGRYSIYNRLIKPDMTVAIFKMGGQSWVDYKNWAENTFANELLKPDVLQLRSAYINPKLSFQWDDVDNQFKVMDSKGNNLLYTKNTGVPGAEPPLGIGVQQTLNRINSSLKNLSNIAKVSNSNVSEYLVNQLMQVGFDPSAKNAPAGLPEHMIRAVAANKLKQKQEEEERAKKYSK